MNYPYATDTVSILIATRNRSDDVRAALESVLRQTRKPDEILVLDDASNPPLAETLDDLNDRLNITWLRSETPSGVSGARNRLTDEANSSILIFLDDDAIFLNDDAIEQSLTVFEQDSEVGIVAFKIETPNLPETDYQLPFTRRAANDYETVNQPHKVSYFVGAAHAIRSTVFERCGIYPVEFIYGHEELDLSYRAIDAGFKIEYQPAARVAHYTKPSVVDGSSRRSTELYFNVRNRIWLAYRNLPLIFALCYVTTWTCYYLLVALKTRNPITWFSGLVAGFKGLSSQNRNPVNKTTVQYLKVNHGRLWM